MIVLVSFLANAGVSFAVGLAVAGLLGPAEFGRYAVAAAGAVVMATGLFEWLRLSATRFCAAAAGTGEPGVRATLEAGYLALALVVAAGGGLVLLVAPGLGWPAPLVAAAAAAGLGMALFDYHAALARAAFEDRTYLGLTVVKNLGALVLMIGAAAAFRDGAAVLAASALAQLLALPLARRRLAAPTPALRGACRGHLAAFAAYALPLVAASFVYQALPLLNRGVLAAWDGFAAAGHYALAADILLRLFAAAGSALDLLLFPLAVRADRERGRAAAEDQIARNVGVVAALVLPFAAGFWLVLPAFEALLIPAAFRGPFATTAAPLVPAFLAWALIQYALNPVFQLRRSTLPVVGAALAGLAVNAGLLAALPGRAGPLGVAGAQLGGMLAALLVLFVTALRQGGLAPPWRDLGLAALATLVMTVAALPLRALPPGLALPASAAAGVLVYGALAVLFDIAGLRGLLRARLSARPAAAPAGP